MTKAEMKCSWVLWGVAILLTAMICCRVLTVFFAPNGMAFELPGLHDKQPLQMGSQWK